MCWPDNPLKTGYINAKGYLMAGLLGKTRVGL